MTDQELYQMVFFVKRPGMYLGNNEIKSIESFLIGYDMAKSNEFGFHRQLIKSIFDNNRHIKEIAELEKGNVHFLQLQTKLISESTKKDELQIFREEALHYLVNLSDYHGKFRYREILKRKLIKTIKNDLDQLENDSDSQHQQLDFIQLSKEILEWTGKNFDDEVIQLVKKLKELNLNNMTDWMSKNIKNVNQAEIREVSNQLIEKITRDNNVHDDHVG
ncbi:MAG: hypothetical protein R2828_34285 [Saprospiraceae bacterium]